MSVCKSIRLIKKESYGDILEVVVGDDTPAIWLYNYDDALSFLNKDVIVSYRKDILDGVLTDFVNTFTVPCVVNTIAADEHVKLYTNQGDNKSNVSFRSIETSTSIPNAIMYCIDQVYENSSSAVWATLTVRDATMRIAKVRVFDYDSAMPNLKNKYIAGNIRKTMYGLQAEKLVPIDTVAQENAEIPIAKQFIQTYLSTNDKQSFDFVESSKLLALMEKVVDYEMGYNIVRLAQELSLCAQFTNLTDAVSVLTVSRALIAQHFYLTIPNASLSKLTRNVLASTKVCWADATDVISCIDVLEDGTESGERILYNKIKETIASIIDIRKGN